MKSDFKVEKSCLAATFPSLCLDSSLLSLMTETHFYAFLLLRETSSSGKGGTDAFWFPTASCAVVEQRLLTPPSSPRPFPIPIPKLDEGIASGRQEVGMVPRWGWLRARTKFG